MASELKSHLDEMLDAEKGCVPCKLCGGKAVITDAGLGAGYYIGCENSRKFRKSEGCLLTERRLGGWAYNVRDWWNRLHAATPPAEQPVEALTRIIRRAVERASTKVPKFLEPYERMRAEVEAEAVEAVLALFRPSAEAAEIVAARPSTASEVEAIGPVERALWADADTPLASFRDGDPGKRVDTTLPTPEWKALTRAARVRGASLSLFVRTAIRQHLAWLAAYRSPCEIEASTSSGGRAETFKSATADDSPHLQAVQPEPSSVAIWSGEHRSYWRKGSDGSGAGYTRNVNDAGVWSRLEAMRLTGGCGPEKLIALHDRPAALSGQESWS